MKRVVFALAVGALLFAAESAAQIPASRFTISISGGLQAAAPKLSDEFPSFEAELREQGTVNVAYPAQQGILVDAGMTYRLRRTIRAGVAVSYATSDGAAQIAARVPHPFLFNAFRDIAGASPKLSRKELGIHPQIQRAVALTRRLHLVLGGGPSYFNVERRLVDTVQFDHVYPYDTATYRSSTSARGKGSGFGFNVSADAIWPFARKVAVGAAVRFARGTVELESRGGRRVDADAGGLQGGAGLRFFF